MHSATLLIELGGVILGLGVLGRLARRIGLSPIPLYLLAGLAFGTGGLYPLTTSEEFISVGAEIGVVLLLLILGLEYSASELVANLRKQAPSGVVDLVLNATPGAVAALLLGWGPVAALALAGITWVSSSGVTAKVLADLGRLGNRETPTILSLLVVEDLAMAVYLPVLTAILVSAGIVSGALHLFVALAAVLVVLVVALRHGRVLSRLVASRDTEVLVLGVLGLALLVAGVAQQLEVSAAVGAFLVGIALSGQVAEGAVTALSPLRDLFAAVFFVFFGLSTDPAAIPPVLPVGLALAVVTVAAKIATGYFAARRAGVRRRGRYRAGTALAARGEFSIVIAVLAVGAGVTPELAALTTTYVLLTVVIGPIAARVVEPALRGYDRLRQLSPRRRTAAETTGMRDRPAERVGAEPPS